MIQVTSQTCVPTSNSCEDDRKFDIVGGAVARSGTVVPGMHEPDIDASHRLAVSRIKMGDIEEGRVGLPRSIRIRYLRSYKIHASFVWRRIFRNRTIVFEIMDAYYDQRMYMAAVTICEELGQDPDVWHPFPHLPDSLTGHRSRCVVSMFWSKSRLVVG